MERFRRSFSLGGRKRDPSSSPARHTPSPHLSSPTPSPHSTAGTGQTWKDDEMKVRQSACSFQVKYLGCAQVFQSRGIAVCEEAIRAMKIVKAGHHRAILYITGDALKVVDEVSKGLLVDQTIEKVSFCSPDRNNDKGFAYICRDGTTRRWLCHGFLALNQSGERLSHAVGCAFTVCLEKKKAREKECTNIRQESSPPNDVISQPTSLAPASSLPGYSQLASTQATECSQPDGLQDNGSQSAGPHSDGSQNTGSQAAGSLYNGSQPPDLRPTSSLPASVKSSASAPSGMESQAGVADLVNRPPEAQRPHLSKELLEIQRITYTSKELLERRRPHAPEELLQRQGSFKEFNRLARTSSPFKRHLSLRLEDLLSKSNRRDSDPSVNLDRPGSDLSHKLGRGVQEDKAISHVSTINDNVMTSLEHQVTSNYLADVCRHVTQGITALSEPHQNTNNNNNTGQAQQIEWKEDVRKSWLDPLREHEARFIRPLSEPSSCNSTSLHPQLTSLPPRPPPGPLHSPRHYPSLDNQTDPHLPSTPFPPGQSFPCHRNPQISALLPFSSLSLDSAQKLWMLQSPLNKPTINEAKETHINQALSPPLSANRISQKQDTELSAADHWLLNTVHVIGQLNNMMATDYLITNDELHDNRYETGPLIHQNEVDSVTHPMNGEINCTHNSLSEGDSLSDCWMNTDEAWLPQRQQMAENNSLSNLSIGKEAQYLSRQLAEGEWLSYVGGPIEKKDPWCQADTLSREVLPPLNVQTSAWSQLGESIGNEVCPRSGESMASKDVWPRSNGALAEEQAWSTAHRSRPRYHQTVEHVQDSVRSRSIDSAVITSSSVWFHNPSTSHVTEDRQQTNNYRPIDIDGWRNEIDRDKIKRRNDHTRRGDSDTGTARFDWSTLSNRPSSLDRASTNKASMLAWTGTGPARDINSTNPFY